MAAKYMSSLLEYLKKIKNLDLIEHTELVSIDNNSKGVTLKLKSNN